MGEIRQFIDDSDCPVERRRIELHQQREAERRRKVQAVQDRRSAEARQRDWEAVIEQHIEQHVTHLVEAIRKVEPDWSRDEFNPLKAGVAELQRRVTDLRAGVEAKDEVAELRRQIAEHRAASWLSRCGERSKPCNSMSPSLRRTKRSNRCGIALTSLR